MTREPPKPHLSVITHNGSGAAVYGDMNGVLVQHAIDQATREDLRAIAQMSPRLASGLENAVRVGVVSAEFVNVMAHIAHVLNEDVAHTFMYAADRLGGDGLARIELLIQQLNMEIESRLSGVVTDLDRTATRIEELLIRFEQAASSASVPLAPATSTVKPRHEATSDPATRVKVFDSSMMALSLKHAAIAAGSLLLGGLLGGIFLALWITHHR